MKLNPLIVTLEKIDTNHPSFPQPENGDEKVWRYLSLSKFLSFALSNKLYLTRIDLLGDSHEGTYTKLNSQTTPEMFMIQDNSGIRESILQRNTRIRKSMFVNCWRLSAYDSEAMWKLYCPTNEGIAIQTTYNKLVDSIPGNKTTYIGLVNYLDYEKDAFDNWNIFNAAMHKRKAFEHEKEVRIIKSESKFWGTQSKPCLIEGIEIQTHLFENIESIYVNPYAPEWFFHTVKKLIDRLDLHLEMKWSEIKSTPYY